MSKSVRVRRRVGDIVAVPVDAARVGYAWVLNDPLLAFFARPGQVGVVPVIEDLVQSPVAFRIWVAHRPIVSGEWPRVGHAPVPEALLDSPWFFKEDPISKRLSVTRGGVERDADAEEVVGMERAAVWSASHVVDRLRDQFDGVPNKGVEALKPRWTMPRR